MGDEKYYTVQVKGTAYRFRPLEPASLERIALVQSMSVDQAKMIKAITRSLAEAAVGDSWDKLTDRWMAKELTTEESTVGILKVLIDRQKADEKKSKVKSAPAADAE